MFWCVTLSMKLSQVRMLSAAVRDAVYNGTADHTPNPRTLLWETSSSLVYASAGASCDFFFVFPRSCYNRVHEIPRKLCHVRSAFCLMYCSPPPIRGDVITNGRGGVTRVVPLIYTAAAVVVRWGWCLLACRAGIGDELTTTVGVDQRHGFFSSTRSI